MNITQIRNATQHITFGGKTFLIDPMLADKGTYPGFAGTARAEIRNPTVDLPVDIDRLLNVDALIVTHLHEDHWDEAAARVVPKDKPIYVQNDRDAQVLREQGFTQLTVLTQNTALGDITLRKTGGQHGSDPSRKWLSVWVMPAGLSSSIRRKKRCIWSGTPSGATRWKPTCRLFNQAWSF